MTMIFDPQNLISSSLSPSGHFEKYSPKRFLRYCVLELKEGHTDVHRDSVSHIGAGLNIYDLPNDKMV